MAVISLIGLADAIYLAVEHYAGDGVRCLITTGCDSVLQSSYSQIYGIPLAMFGVVFYAGMFILISLADIYKNRPAHGLLLLAGSVGFIASLTFLYLQLFVINALCFYCLVSLCTSSALFILSVVLYRKG